MLGVDEGRRFLDGLHPDQMDLPVLVDTDLGVGGQPSADLPVRPVQGVGVAGQQGIGDVRQAESGEYVGPDRPHAGPS
jgi:hypothetical protein